jgi:hypothetical protein
MKEFKTYNPIICEYYEDNEDFEEANILLIKLFKLFKNMKGVSLNEFLNETLDNIKSFDVELKELYPESTIISQDNYYSLLRDDLPTYGIYLYNCEDTVTLNDENIQNYLDSVDILIIVSHNSEIDKTKNYEVQIQNNKIVSYIHNLNYEYYKLNTTINNIDMIYAKLFEINHKNGDKIWNEINKEFMILQQQKELVTKFIKDQMSVMLENVKIMELPILSTQLNEKFKNPRKPCITCNLCNLYISTTLKGMSAHKRGCIKKMPGVAPIVKEIKAGSSNPFL